MFGLTTQKTHHWICILYFRIWIFIMKLSYTVTQAVFFHFKFACGFLTFWYLLEQTKYHYFFWQLHNCYKSMYLHWLLNCWFYGHCQTNKCLRDKCSFSPGKKKSWLGSLIWGPFIKCIPFTKWFSHEKRPHWAHDWKIPYNFQLGLMLVGQ